MSAVSRPSFYVLPGVFDIKYLKPFNFNLILFQKGSSECWRRWLRTGPGQMSSVQVVSSSILPALSHLPRYKHLLILLFLLQFCGGFWILIWPNSFWFCIVAPEFPPGVTVSDSDYVSVAFVGT